MRTKTFNPEEIVDKATRLFWERGYLATSISDLVDHLGLNRSSLYNAFGSKDEFFNRCIERYWQWLDQSRGARMAASDQPLATLERLFLEAAAGMEGPQAGRGCLIVNTAASAPPDDDLARELSDRLLQRQKQAIHQALERARDAGELADHVDLAAAAQMLNSMAAGMAVLARTKTSRAGMKSAVTELFSGLKR